MTTTRPCLGTEPILSRMKGLKSASTTSLCSADGKKVSPPLKSVFHAQQQRQRQQRRKNFWCLNKSSPLLSLLSHMNSAYNNSCVRPSASSLLNSCPLCCFQPITLARIFLIEFEENGGANCVRNVFLYFVRIIFAFLYFRQRNNCSNFLLKTIFRKSLPTLWFLYP